ncbi:MAG: hypothetical protein KGL35_20620 [Bradyrhizobium sp.]|nr:hypothetical protein [Pseudomonadota bacterium]MDE2471078.1 hypothetical protein [Bradyrhizobium sp.]
MLALAVILTNASQLARAADVTPKFDIVKNCKAETADASGTGESIASCIEAEERARQELTVRWTHFNREDKATCIHATSADGSPSYVELKICLEMASDNRTRLKGTR